MPTSSIFKCIERDRDRPPGDEGREDGLRIFDLPFVKRTREQKTPRKREREREEIGEGVGLI